MDEFKQLAEKKVSSEKIFDGVVLHVVKDAVTLPNGNPATRELIRHVGAVAVVPMTEDGKVIVERQYRYPMDMVITEIPAGKLDSKTEDPLEAAKRELREETGITADEWTNLGIYFPTPAYSDEQIHVYLARGLHRGTQDLDEDEFLCVKEIPLEELVNEIMEGKICDGKTQFALLKTARLLGK